MRLKKSINRKLWPNLVNILPLNSLQSIKRVFWFHLSKRAVFPSIFNSKEQAI